MSQETSSIKQLLSSLKVLPSDKTAVFIFTSPQAIVNHNNELHDYLITNKLICFIVVNEIHLLVNHFGKFFRSEFGALKEKLFVHL